MADEPSYRASAIRQSITEIDKLCENLISQSFAFGPRIMGQWEVTKGYIEDYFADGYRKKFDLRAYEDRVSKLQNSLDLVSIRYDRSRDPDATKDTLGRISAFVSAIDIDLRALILAIYGENDADDLPPQYFAPVQVAEKNNRLVTLSDRHHTGPLPESTIEQTRLAVHSTLERLLTETTYTNADRKLQAPFRELLEELTFPADSMRVIWLGFKWQVAGDTLDGVRESVPDALIPQYDRVLSAVQTMLSQYSEWAAYQASEAAKGFKPEQVKPIAKDAEEIKEVLKKDPNVADEEIPKRLDYILFVVKTGVVHSEALLAPLVGSVSNIMAAAAHVVLERAPWVLENISNLTVSATKAYSGAVVLVGVCIALIKIFAKRLMKYPSFKWLKNVHETAMKYYDQFKDLIDK